ncbi:MAG: RNA ligase family protein [Ruminococcus sp.]|uniref:RNA ligase family protein n=1 Tax=Ruminococcus sp. TaxID=41978 RepID=UPI002872F9FF|nr:RNA ligase family protein [Ruminococcus sp.]MBQ3284545.1 RNA ligase family protein [Ruminococcus sp.]
MEELKLIKYPRTPHIEGSRLQPGDEDLSQIPFRVIQGKYIVVEEKVDGANTAISFSPDGELLLQSRGHYIEGGYREKHYNLLKQWASVQKDSLYCVLGSRYIMYGEWLYAKHTVYYDALPHYFLEFDIFDRKSGKYLDTDSRYKLIKDLPVCSVPVLKRGVFQSREELLKLLGRSNYITEKHLENLRKESERFGLDVERQIRETDNSNLMEGLYIKVEENGEVVERMKFVRASFLQTVDASETHWLERPIVPNKLAVPIDSLFEVSYEQN